MRLLPLLLIFALFSFPHIIHAQKESTVLTTVIKTNIYCDHCKECGTCGEIFNKVLLREKGIQMVALDAEKMTIKVTYNSKKTDLDKIRLAISRLGYDADEIKADDLAYNALDGCCKK